jgi:hypothetical protein
MIAILWTAIYRKTQIISTHLRHVAHNWGFNPEQKELLECYCNANKLLIDCLKSSCVVSNEVREAIEDTLLLPICEIEKRQREKTD